MTDLLGWMTEAEPARDCGGLIGEDENGLLWVPSRTREGWWDRRLNLRNPTHWPAYLRSRRRRAYAFIETA